jgi:hypothetical protein
MFAEVMIGLMSKKTSQIIVDRSDGVSAIVTSKGHEILFDTSDKHLVEGRGWFPEQVSYTYYARCSKAFGRQHIHRVILSPPDGLIVDHKNRNGLDNRRCNLRVCTPNQNTVNSRISTRNTSGYRGVHWCNTYRIWRASIKDGSAYRTIGRFNSAEEAAAAYDIAARRIWGEFAVPNLPVKEMILSA